MRRLMLVLAGSAAVALIGCAGGDDQTTATPPETAPPREMASNAGWVIEDLGALPGCKECWAVAINELGQVIGNCQTSTGSAQGFFWQNGKITDLGTLAGRESVAVDINNRSHGSAAAINDDGRQVVARQLHRNAFALRALPRGALHLPVTGRKDDQSRRASRRRWQFRSRGHGVWTSSGRRGTLLAHPARITIRWFAATS
jgi:probable HAF family extracellular repeat protein